MRVMLELSDCATAVIRNFGQLQAHNAFVALWRRLLAQARQAGQLREGIGPVAS